MSENFKIDIICGAILFILAFCFVCWKYDQKIGELNNFQQQAIENGAAHWVIIDHKGNTTFEWIEK